jgi:hypothetical protein
MATEADAVRKVLNIAERVLNFEEYARFLAARTPKVGDSVKELREYRDAEAGGPQSTKQKLFNVINIPF